MTPPSLRRRIRNGTLSMLGIALVFGTVALPRVHRLGRAIRDTLYRNYTSIKSATHMQQALYQLELAQSAGTLSAVLPASRASFVHWLDLEKHNETEIGEAEVVTTVERQWHELVARLQDGQLVPPQDFRNLDNQLTKISEINETAMFRADSRANKMSSEVASEFTIGLTLLLVLGTVLSLTLARNIAHPLSELSDRLRNFDLPGNRARLADQPLAELQAVATEFNKMADRLEQFERLNVDRLVMEKNKTEAIVENIDDGIVLIDHDARIAHLNEVAATILGVDRAAVIGRSFASLGSASPAYTRIRAAFEHDSNQNAATGRLEVEGRRGAERRRYALKVLRLRAEGDQSSGRILVLQDVTYLRDRANLVATLSHELKTPLTSLGAAAELLHEARPRLDDKDQELIATINEDIGLMRQLVEDLLALARGEIGSIAIHTAPLDLEALIRSVMRTFTPQAEQKGVTLRAITTASLPPVSADRVKLSWVFSNLIANALRYTPAGGTIAISARPTPGAVELEVRDSGIGIDPSIVDHLFERFTQWEVDGAVPGSAGLGLAIARDIVEAHGGRISVDSRSGEGTCFTVELPFPRQDAWRDF
ncbi:MAG TPA: ATP-binding protein [Candidatus Binataceae bacterium]|nr:ATP-binding protein [Candidatus Binataceae bacterium]